VKGALSFFQGLAQSVEVGLVVFFPPPKATWLAVVASLHDVRWYAININGGGGA
jgi:hypothetical protein